ncbi:MAG: penicillin-binding transpeptidase domain-containing protein, partial [Myxococcota bacterium]
AALDEGDTQLDTALDAPLALVAGKNRLWEPQNAGGYFLGRVALRWAFAHSLNTPAVRLAARYGTLGVIRRARAAGIRSPIRRDLTMALGTSELRPIELAVGIAGIVRGGVAVKPAWIDRLVDFDGEDVGRAGRRVALPGVGVQLPGGEGPRFMAPGPAWEVVDMMRAAIERGTGKAAFAKGEFRGGKTGTTSGNKDAWFVGFARGHVVAVWLGQDDGRTLGWGESGGRAALPAWRTIVEALPPGPDPERPPDVIALPFLDAHVDVTADHVPQFRMRHHIPREDEPLPAAPRKLRPRARRRAPQPDAVPEPVVEGESS